MYDEEACLNEDERERTSNATIDRAGKAKKTRTRPQARGGALGQIRRKMQRLETESAITHSLTMRSL